MDRTIIRVVQTQSLPVKPSSSRKRESSTRLDTTRQRIDTSRIHHRLLHSRTVFDIKVFVCHSSEPSPGLTFCFPCCWISVFFHNPGRTQQTLTIVVIGASGDLAKKKTYPSLLSLFESTLLPNDTVIWGYARSAKTHEELRDHLRPHLIKTGTSEIIVNDFLSKCYYHAGLSYGDEEAYTELVANISKFEASTPSAGCNRLFYLAIPPNVFGESGLAIKKVGMATTGWTRVVIEKPFGRDLDSCNELLETLAVQFEEDNMYRVSMG